MGPAAPRRGSAVRSAIGARGRDAETLLVGDLVEKMLDTTWSRSRRMTTRSAETCASSTMRSTRSRKAIKLYLARVDRAKMDDAARRQASNVLEYAIKLDSVGDIVERSLSPPTIKTIEKQLRYSPEGMSEFELFRTIDNLHLAQQVFINGDTRSASPDGGQGRYPAQGARLGRTAYGAAAGPAPRHAADDLASHGRAARSQAHPIRIWRRSRLSRRPACCAKAG
jgi:hypothetical protein